jgi:hypothetical protein
MRNRRNSGTLLVIACGLSAAMYAFSVQAASVTSLTSQGPAGRLPQIYSIVADTDIRPFLQAGVPEALTLAALRRAWVADPAICGFIGIAENQWNFNEGTSIREFRQPADAIGKTGRHAAWPSDRGQRMPPLSSSTSRPPHQEREKKHAHDHLNSGSPFIARKSGLSRGIDRYIAG